MLKNPIPELALFFDLEWVPDAAGAKRLFDLAEETTELEAMQRIWEQSPQYKEEENPRPFLKYMFSRVVSIAFLSRKSGYRDGERVTEFSLNSLPKLPLESDDVDEAVIIERFLYIVGDRCPQLVGFNSADSDLQVLIQRGMINEVTAPAFCKRPNKPWEGPDYFDSRNSEAHLDLIKRFYGGTRSIRSIRTWCGCVSSILPDRSEKKITILSRNSFVNSSKTRPKNPKRHFCHNS